jgi:hypothetical protein
LDPPPTGVDLLLGLVAASEHREVLLPGLHVVGGGAAALAEAVGRGAAMEVCGAVVVCWPWLRWWATAGGSALKFELG